MSGAEEAGSIDFDAIELQGEVDREYGIEPGVYEAFLAAFDDRSPIHVDDAFARARGFPSKVMHGAILNGFLSHFVGMVFPGRGSLLLTVDIRYREPSYLGDRLRLTARVEQKVESQGVVVLRFRFENLTTGKDVAAGKAQVRVTRDG